MTRQLSIWHSLWGFLKLQHLQKKETCISNPSWFLLEQEFSIWVQTPYLEVYTFTLVRNNEKWIHRTLGSSSLLPVEEKEKISHMQCKLCERRVAFMSFEVLRRALSWQLIALQTWLHWDIIHEVLATSALDADACCFSTNGRSSNDYPWDLHQSWHLIRLHLPDGARISTRHQTDLDVLHLFFSIWARGGHLISYLFGCILELTENK